MDAIVITSGVCARARVYFQVEDYLADFLDDNFSTYAEDGSPAQVLVSYVPLTGG